MGKKAEAPKPVQAPAEADVAFDFTAGELRTTEIKWPGNKPFAITYRVPGVGGRADMFLASVVKDDASRGEEMVRLVARHLVSWTIPKPASWPADRPWPSFDAVAAIKSPGVLFAMFNAITEAGEARKN